MVLFGELVIPSSRALWDEEFDDQQIENNSSFCLEWKGDTTVPNNISNFLIMETSKLNNVAISCLENESKPLTYLVDTNVKIYKLKYNNYLLLCGEEKNVSVGEVIEMIIPWVENSEKIVCITSCSTSMFQNNKSEEMPACFIKGLSSKVEMEVENSMMTSTSLLDVPNLINGFCAGVISYCHHIKKCAVLYVCYIDARPLDSITAHPILELLKHFNIPTDKPFAFKPQFTTHSNLYM